jgi:hypothetical protein
MPGNLFEFVQSAGFLAQKRSHLKYVLWFGSQMNLNWLTPGCLTIRRGLKLKKKRYGLDYSWKARFFVYLN